MNYKIALTVLSTSILLPSFSYAIASKYELDPVHTKVEFGERHLGINTVKGEFKKFTGTIEYDPKNPQSTKVNAEIDPSSIDTKFLRRQKNLKLV